MKAAGYEYDKATGTYERKSVGDKFSIDSDGHLYYSSKHGSGTLPDKLTFDSKDPESIYFADDQSNPKSWEYSMNKYKALKSSYSPYWVTVGERLKLKGKFYDSMLKAGYHFVPDKGYYMNNDGIKIYTENKGKKTFISTDGREREISAKDLAEKVLKLKN